MNVRFLPCVAVCLCIGPHAGVVRGGEDADWALLRVPGFWEAAGGKLASHDGFAWYRCLIKVPPSWKGQPLRLTLGSVDDCDETFFNGQRVGATGTMPPIYKGLSARPRKYAVPAKAVRPGAYNLIAIRVYDGGGSGGFTGSAFSLSCPKGSIDLQGDWQFRTGDGPAWGKWPADPDSEEGRKMAEDFHKSSDSTPGAAQPELAGEAPPPQGALTLWYRRPANQWVEALPIGNGRLGAMVFGGITRERLQLNEDTLWDGYPRKATNPAALKALPEVRRLLFEGKNKEATDLAHCAP